MPARWKRVFLGAGLPTREGILADSARDLQLNGLQRAAAAPEGMPLLAGKTAPGLFPAHAAGKKAAQMCLDQGWLEVVRTERRGIKNVACTGITEAGLAWLLEQVQPRQILTAFIEAVDARRQQLDELLDLVRAQQDALAALGQRVDRVLSAPKTPLGHEPTTPVKDPTSTILDTLETWQRGGSLGDCPLPHLFNACAPITPSIGQFHDTVRSLRDGGRIYLHPWTGPLYEIPEPALALLTGHEVAYYASPRLGGAEIPLPRGFKP